QVPELDAGVVTGGLEPVITGVDGDRVDREEQVRLSRDPGAEPPGSVSAGWSRACPGWPRRAGQSRRAGPGHLAALGPGGSQWGWRGSWVRAGRSRGRS